MAYSAANAYNAYSNYKEKSISTMTPGEMVVRLFEECEKQLHIASLGIEKSDMIKANAALKKSQNIIRYLNQCLDHKYTVSEGLSKLYDFFLNRMIDANIKKSKQPIEEILPMITELRDTFQQAERLARIK